MTYQPAIISDDLNTLPKLPTWVTSGRVETPEAIAFRSGAALTVLDQLVTDPQHGVPVKLLANRLALKAATATSKLEGRLAGEADIRDAYHLTPQGDARGPDGDLLAFWREGARLRLSGKDRHHGLEDIVGPSFSDDVIGLLVSGVDCAQTHGPIAGAEIVVQARILESVEETIRLARELTRRAEALRTVAPKLRAKGSEAAVDLFLTEDAVAPASMLSPRIRGTSISMTDRAARRFCDRLVELGVARELTGRPTFRLYGIAS